MRNRPTATSPAIRRFTSVSIAAVPGPVETSVGAADATSPSTSNATAMTRRARVRRAASRPLPSMSSRMSLIVAQCLPGGPARQPHSPNPRPRAAYRATSPATGAPAPPGRYRERPPPRPQHPPTGFPMIHDPDRDPTAVAERRRPAGRSAGRSAAATGFRWYGPTLLLLLTVLGVMLLGPGMIRSVAQARSQAELVAVRNGLQSDPSLTALSDAFKEVARAVEPSVVHVEIQSRSNMAARGRMNGEDPFGNVPDSLLPPGLRERLRPPGAGPGPAEPGGDGFSQYREYTAVGNGSGWVYHFPGSEDGGEPAADYIVTNAHVVRDVGETERIQVTLFDHTVATAEVVGTPDDKTDVAVLRLSEPDPDALHPASTGTGPVEQGEIVFAFGSPFGSQFSFSMSQGIVSAVGREVGIIGLGGYENFIQTDAAINPGNSGGPLVNVRGEIIGMNTAIATSNRGMGGGGSNSGVGFAIPVKMATRVADGIITNGAVQRGYLGVRFEPPQPGLLESFGHEGEGVLVSSVEPGGPAAAAGLRDSDIITAVDGTGIRDGSDLRLAIGARNPGEDVEVTVFRNGETKTYPVTLGSLEGVTVASSGPQPNAGGPTRNGVSELAQRFGITGLRTIDGGAPAALRLPPDAAGVLVTGVREGSVAAGGRVSLRPNETLITAVMDTEVASVEAFNEALGGLDPQKPIRLTVLRLVRQSADDPGTFQQSFVLLKLP